MELKLKLDNFEGPLDLLLYLLEKKEMKIIEVKISELIDEYLFLVEEAQNGNVSIKVEFLGIASELLEIKALSILNMREKEKKEEALSQKLAEYKLFKDISLKLSEIENIHNVSYTKFSRGKNVIKVPNRDFDMSNLSTNLIFDMYSKYIENKEVYKVDIKIKYDLKEEKDKLWSSMSSIEEVKLDKIFSQAKDNLHLVYLFLSVLELYRDNEITILEGRIKINSFDEVKNYA